MSLSKQINNEALDEDLKIYRNIVNMTKKQVKEFGREIDEKHEIDSDFQLNLKEYIDDLSQIILNKINKFINTDSDKVRYLNLEDIIQSYNRLSTYLSSYISDNILTNSNSLYIEKSMNFLLLLLERLLNLVKASPIRNRKELLDIIKKLVLNNYTPISFLDSNISLSDKELEKEKKSKLDKNIGEKSKLDEYVKEIKDRREEIDYTRFGEELNIEKNTLQELLIKFNNYDDLLKKSVFSINNDFSVDNEIIKILKGIIITVYFRDNLDRAGHDEFPGEHSETIKRINKKNGKTVQTDLVVNFKDLKCLLRVND